MVWAEAACTKRTHSRDRRKDFLPIVCMGMGWEEPATVASGLRGLAKPFATEKRAFSKGNIPLPALTPCPEVHRNILHASRGFFFEPIPQALVFSLQTQAFSVPPKDLSRPSGQKKTMGGDRHPLFLGSLHAGPSARSPAAEVLLTPYSNP
jgi:hypothetical protein